MVPAAELRRRHPRDTEHGRRRDQVRWIRELTANLMEEFVVSGSDRRRTGPALEEGQTVRPVRGEQALGRQRGPLGIFFGYNFRYSEKRYYYSSILKHVIIIFRFPQVCYKICMNMV